MPRPTLRPGRLALFLASLALAGCTDRPGPSPGPSVRVDDFKKIRFAGEEVVVPFRRGLPRAPVGEAVGDEGPKVGDRVVLSDVGEGEVFLALDLEALKFYHSSPGVDQLGRFRLLGSEGRLFVVPRGAVGTVARVAEGELPGGLKAIELDLAGPKGGTAWVGEPFVRRPSLEPAK